MKSFFSFPYQLLLLLFYFSILIFFFQSDSIKVLWSYGERDPIHGNIKGHSKNRGWKNMHLLGPHFRKPVQKDGAIQQWDVTVKNVRIKNVFFLQSII